MPLEFGLKDFIDIFLVALMLFYCYKVMKESRSLNVFFGVLIFVVFWLFVSQILEMKLLGSILDKTGQRRYTGTDYPVPRRNPQLLFHDRYTPASGKSPQTHPAQQERQ